MVPADSGIFHQPLPSCMATRAPEEGHQQCTATDNLEYCSPAPQVQQQGMSSPHILLQQQGDTPGTLVYPSALTFHDAVVQDRDLFYDTLNKFHASLGTRLTIPTIGGKELDLHLLYVEVTSRGGLEQVIRERKWKEITVAFNFPPTTTSASFVLRKYYVSLLHHYEQVYFFGKEGQLVPPPIAASLPSQSPGGHQAADNGAANNGGVENGEVVLKKRRRRTQDPAEVNRAELLVPIGHEVSGVIDGKFEHGYLVTVIVGTKKLRGVLYHLPLDGGSSQFSMVTDRAKGGVVNSIPEVRRRRRRRRKDEMPKKDPNAPKPNRSGYNFFFQEHRRRLKALHPDKDKELSKMIGELWNKQTEEERAVYQERGVKDKERYKKEMEEYRGGLRAQALAGEDDGARADGGACLPAGHIAMGRPDHSGSSFSEADSLPTGDEEKLKDGTVLSRGLSI